MSIWIVYKDFWLNQNKKMFLSLPASAVAFSDTPVACDYAGNVRQTLAY